MEDGSTKTSKQLFLEILECYDSWLIARREFERFQAQEDDCLCKTCYDQLINAFNFKQKWHQSRFHSRKDMNSGGTALVKEENDENSGFPQISEIKIESNTELEETPNADSRENETDNIEDCLVNNSKQSNEDKQSQNEQTGDVKYINTMLDSYDTLKSKVEDAAQTKEKEKIIQCEICNQTFPRPDNYHMHLRQMHYFGERRDKIIRRGPVPRYHENDIFGNLKETQCEFCYKIFSTLNELQEHEKHHKEEERPYRCNKSDCPARFKYRYRARYHIINHAGEKRYKCRYCDKKFHQSSNVKAHERSHTGEKPFVCSHCDKGFSSNKRLTEHIRIHTGEQPFQCSKCGKNFNRSETLKIHERMHTGMRPFQCQMCSSAFVSKSRLIKHTKIHFSFLGGGDYNTFSQLDKQ